MSVNVSTPIARRARLTAIGAILTAAVLVTVLAGISLGPAGVSLSDAAAALLRPIADRLGVDMPGATQAGTALIWTIRLPRVVLAGLVGASLAVAGVVMQAVFRNPLAEPGITGVSSGAAAAAVLVIVTGAASAAPWLLPAGAFAGAIIAVFFVQLVAGLRGGGGATLLLVGIALNAFLGAIISAAIANAPSSDDAQQAMFWLNGDLTATTWGDVRLAVGPILVGVALLMFSVPELNLFLLGDDQAAASGMRTTATRHIVLALAALVTAAGVAVTGVISFVGLVVPHAVRLVLGPDHRILLPTAMASGAVFLMVADLVARNVFHPVVLQTGTITAVIGAPVLLALVLRDRQVR